MIKSHKEYLEKIMLANMMSYAYYELDNPIATDDEYDRLERDIETYEEKYPDKISNDSPTQRIGPPSKSYMESLYNLTATEKNIAIIYTDGSFKPNVESDPTLGCYGAGVHGYVFNTLRSGKTTADSPQNYYITKSGYVINTMYDKDTDTPVIPSYYIDGVYGFLNKGTISQAELLGIICSLTDLLKHNEIFKLNKVIIYSDSTYALDVFGKVICELDTFSFSTDTANFSLYEDMRKILLQYRHSNIEVSAEKIQAHTIHIGNNMADDNAYLARKQSGERTYINKFTVFDTNLDGKKANKYWSNNIEENELLKFKQLFFTNSLRAQRDEIIYSVMNYKTDVEPGTRTHDALLGLVSVANPPAIIEDAIKHFHKSTSTTSVLSTINLKNLYSRDVSYPYSLYGDRIYTYVHSKRSLLKRSTPIITPVNPPGLSTKLLMDMQFMYNFISIYRTIKDTLTKEEVMVNKSLLFTNITDRIYGINAKKKISCIIPQGNTYIDIVHTINEKSIKFPISLGKDTLDRNNFKRLESNSPTVILIVDIKSNKFFEYYTLIDVNGDIGVYTNLYSNKVVTE